MNDKLKSVESKENAELVERRILRKLTYIFDAKTVDVEWRDEILKGDKVVSSNPYNGSYILNENGEVDETVQSEIGMKISDILGEAADEVMKNSIKDKQDMAALAGQLSQAQLTISALNQDVQNAETMYRDVSEQLNSVIAERDGLQIKYSALVEGMKLLLGE